MDVVLPTLAAAFAVWIAWRFVAALRRDSEALRRSDHGLCRGCGHNLAGSEVQCRTCGRPFQPHEAVKVRPRVCPTCGYDVRATRDRCPECGSVVGANV